MVIVLSTPDEVLSGIDAEDELQKSTFVGGTYVGMGLWKAKGKYSKVFVVVGSSVTVIADAALIVGEK